MDITPYSHPEIKLCNCCMWDGQWRSCKSKVTIDTVDRNPIWDVQSVRGLLLWPQTSSRNSFILPTLRRRTRMVDGKVGYSADCFPFEFIMLAIGRPVSRSPVFFSFHLGHFVSPTATATINIFIYSTKKCKKLKFCLGYIFVPLLFVCRRGCNNFPRRLSREISLKRSLYLRACIIEFRHNLRFIGAYLQNNCEC